MTEASPIHLIARFVPRAGQEPALAQVVAELVARVLPEPGCILYAAHESREAPGAIVMIETWADQAALDLHGKGAAIAWLIPQLDALLAKPIAIEHLRRI